LRGNNIKEVNLRSKQSAMQNNTRKQEYTMLNHIIYTQHPLNIKKQRWWWEGRREELRDI